MDTARGYAATRTLIIPAAASVIHDRLRVLTSAPWKRAFRLRDAWPVAVMITLDGAAYRLNMTVPVSRGTRVPYEGRLTLAPHPQGTQLDLTIWLPPLTWQDYFWAIISAALLIAWFSEVGDTSPIVTIPIAGFFFVLNHLAGAQQPPGIARALAASLQRYLAEPAAAEP